MNNITKMQFSCHIQIQWQAIFLQLKWYHAGASSISNTDIPQWQHPTSFLQYCSTSYNNHVTNHSICMTTRLVQSEPLSFTLELIALYLLPMQLS